MRNYRQLVEWLGQLDSALLVCGQLHPDLRVPCEKALGHSTTGRSGRDRAHVGRAPEVDYRPIRWTLIDDHKWRLDQKRRGRHPAGGSET